MGLRDKRVEHAGAAATPDRFVIAGQLREIGELLALDGGNPYRARAYTRAAQALENLDSDFPTLLRAERLTEIGGIGAALARVIHELAETGGADVLNRLRRQFPAAVVELSRIVSLPQARALHETLGVTTLEELRAACATGSVRAVRGFGEKTEQRLLARIDALASSPEQVLLPEAAQQMDELARYLAQHPSIVRVEPAGQLRRRVEAVDRLDVVVASDDGAAVATHARRYPRALAVVAQASNSFLLRQAGGLEVHVRVVAPRDLVAAWIEATGSAGHVAKLRARAAERGLRLSGDGVRRANRRVQLRSEAELYRALGLADIPPELREDAGEVEAAAAGTLPADLVRLEDLQGVVHCHTTYSDGKGSIEQMARGAEALGLRYLTITDHSASATYARGLTVDRLRRQRDEIARVQQRVGVQLLLGTESDILRDGALDYPDAVLQQLDVVIASVHNRFKMDAAAMTERLVRAMRHPLFKIWGHALGRYVLSRPPFACDMDAVLDAIAASRAVIEVNGDPHRLDMEPRWVREARRRGIRFVVSADAHSVNALRNLRWGVDIARRGWVRRDEVLNTLGPAEFAAAVRP